MSVSGWAWSPRSTVASTSGARGATKRTGSRVKGGMAATCDPPGSAVIEALCGAWPGASITVALIATGASAGRPQRAVLGLGGQFKS